MKNTANFKKLALLFGAFLFGSTVFAAGAVRAISVSDMAEKIDQRRAGKADFMLVDLRNEVDYAKGHLPGAVNLPVSKHILPYGLVAQKDREVIFYGYSGKDKAAMNTPIWAVNRGLSKVYILDGGFKGWSGDIEK